MDKYYIVEKGQKSGPFSAEELKQKGLHRDTLVWTEGLDNWTKAENIPMLKEVLRATPPPIPNTEEPKKETVPPQISEPQGKYFGYVLARRRERFFAYLVQAIIIITPFLIIFGTEFLEEDSRGDLSSYVTETVIGAIFGAILGVIFYPIWSGNLGHKIFGLKVISAEDGSDYNTARQGAIREFIKEIFGAVIIPIIWLLWDKDKQNLYDKVIKTYVVKKKLAH